MPKKNKSPTAPVRSVLKRSRAKGRGIKQKDLVADSDKANPTEPLQVRPEDAPRAVATTHNVRPQLAPLTALPAMTEPPPPPTYDLIPPPLSRIYSEQPERTLFNNDDLGFKTQQEEIKTITETPAYEPTEFDKKYLPYSFPQNPWDATQTKLKPNLGQKMSYGDDPVEIFSDATSRFLNSLSDFFGGLSNPNK